MTDSPQPIRIEVIDAAVVVIEWDDNTVSRLSAAELRAFCPCAQCREEQRHIESLPVSVPPVTVTISKASLVGGYALNFVFGPDAHGTGIYPFHALYEMGQDSSA